VDDKGLDSHRGRWQAQRKPGAGRAGQGRKGKERKGRRLSKAAPQRNPPFHSGPNSGSPRRWSATPTLKLYPSSSERGVTSPSLSLSLSLSQMNESQSHRHHVHSRPLSDCPDLKLTDLQRSRRVSSSIGISNSPVQPARQGSSIRALQFALPCFPSYLT
jgi:hypothetical protein